MKITIFGFAGSGTSTIWKMLAGKLNHDFMSTGNIMRTWAAEQGMDIYEFEKKITKKDHSFDHKLDKKVEDYWKENSNFIFESRLAWNFIPDSYKIFLHCDDEERYNRIHNREWWEREEIVNKTHTREAEVIRRYGEVYPDIVFPPQKEDFDLFIDSTKIWKEEVVNKILSAIKN